MPHMRSTVGLLASKVAVIHKFENCTLDQSHFLAAVSTQLQVPPRHALIRCTDSALLDYYDGILHRNWDAFIRTKVQDIFISSNEQYIFILMDDKHTIYSFEEGAVCRITLPDYGLNMGRWYMVTKFIWHQASAKWPSQWSGPCLKLLENDGVEYWYWRTKVTDPDGSIKTLELGRTKDSKSIRNEINTTFGSHQKALEADEDWAKMQVSRSQSVGLVADDNSMDSERLRPTWTCLDGFRKGVVQELHENLFWSNFAELTFHSDQNSASHLHSRYLDACGTKNVYQFSTHRNFTSSDTQTKSSINLSTAKTPPTPRPARKSYLFSIYQRFVVVLDPVKLSILVDQRTQAQPHHPSSTDQPFRPSNQHCPRISQAHHPPRPKTPTTTSPSPSSAYQPFRQSSHQLLLRAMDAQPADGASPQHSGPGSPPSDSEISESSSVDSWTDELITDEEAEEAMHFMGFEQERERDAKSGAFEGTGVYRHVPFGPAEGTGGGVGGSAGGVTGGAAGGWVGDEGGAAIVEAGEGMLGGGDGQLDEEFAAMGGDGVAEFGLFGGNFGFFGGNIPEWNPAIAGLQAAALMGLQQQEAQGGPEEDFDFDSDSDIDDPLPFPPANPNVGLFGGNFGFFGGNIPEWNPAIAGLQAAALMGLQQQEAQGEPEEDFDFDSDSDIDNPLPFPPANPILDQEGTDDEDWYWTTDEDQDEEEDEIDDILADGPLLVPAWSDDEDEEDPLPGTATQYSGQPEATLPLLPPVTLGQQTIHPHNHLRTVGAHQRFQQLTRISLFCERFRIFQHYINLIYTRRFPNQLATIAFRKSLDKDRIEMQAVIDLFWYYRTINDIKTVPLNDLKALRNKASRMDERIIPSLVSYNTPANPFPALLPVVALDDPRMDMVHGVAGHCWYNSPCRVRMLPEDTFKLVRRLLSGQHCFEE
ncbi:hypothetical protein BJ508DRAFT_331123 [Ascobolus immersus RN42]|uniref:Uncharacterized protein n=1 Tax=Ascobolus immersus RN42 TaxID=1160509 RepID=A0A3N4HRK3_ASCIM|nr:hypothetical protein BJ508DRAFT_331123 [Ascobolus immersus RN42]